MTCRHFRGATLLLTVLFLAAGCAATKRVGGPTRDSIPLRLPKVFGDHMVLQRDFRVPVWGWGKPGARVVVEFAGQRKMTVVGNDGRWRLELDPVPAGGPFELRVIGEDTLRFRDVLVGEVWLASGQSNMEMPVRLVKDAEAEIRAANLPRVRLLTVERTRAFRPCADIKTEGWKLCSPRTVAGFSAVAYFFGRELYHKLGVPIGLIHSSWGGTPAEAWTSHQTLSTLPDFAKALAEVDSLAARGERDLPWDEQIRRWEVRVGAWVRSVAAADTGFGLGWYRPGLRDASWDTMSLPRPWENSWMGAFDGVVWFRKTVKIPTSWSGHDLRLSLGPIDDIDSTWFNGYKLGGESRYNKPRVYTVPGEVVQPGENTIVVRVVDYGGNGGLWGTREQLRLTWPGHDSLSLAGVWRCRASLSMANVPPLPRHPAYEAHRPTVLFNGMIAPLIPFAIRGVIWYQGESNAWRAAQYRSLFPAMIEDWRRHWGEGNFPFFYVQLANFRARKAEPGESDWAELREAQFQALRLPNTGMAVTIDIGEANDIHPKNKQDVGHRLALIARAKVYGEDVPYSGPLYRRMEVEGSKIRLYFDHADGGLQARGDSLQGFAVAGPDRVFHWAQARIERETVVVWNPDVLSPVAVRYAWADNPVCTLINRAGLPASPFRTDHWPGITEHHR